MINTGRKWPPKKHAPLPAANQQPIRSHASCVVQPKVAGQQPRKTLVAPPVYRPQPLPKVLQPMSAIPSQPHARTNCGRACHPQATPAMQPKPLAGLQPGSRPSAPPAYRPQPTPKCLQLKSAAKQTSSAAHAKPTPPIAGNFHVRTAQGILQAKSGETRASATVSKPRTGSVKGPMRGAGNPSGRSSVIQRWITWDASNLEFDRDGGRPGGHLNLGVIASILEDIIQKGALTEVEDELLLLTVNGKTVKEKAQQLKSGKLLSVQGYAVCHKIPYAAFEKALLKLIHKSYKPGVAANSNAWNALEDLLNVLYKTPNGPYNHKGDLENAVSQKSQSTIVSEANNLLAEFDKCDDNLYVGFSMTNSSIGENVDLHFPVLKTMGNIVKATPRGQSLQDALNRLENTLGLPPTTTIDTVDKQQVTWTASSSVYGKISAGTGFVQTS